jgi:hypothetical protein
MNKRRQHAYKQKKRLESKQKRRRKLHESRQKK